MKALSVLQPWASALALGQKRVETRSRRTHYRGSVLIHAGARRLKDYDAIVHELLGLWRGRQGGAPKALFNKWCYPTLGCIIAVAEITDCRPTESFVLGEQFPVINYSGNEPRPDWRTFTREELALGDYSPGRFGWTFCNARLLAEPIPYRGMLGFFEVRDELIEGKLP